MNFLSLAIKLLPTILAIVQAIVTRANEQKLISEGERKAIFALTMEIAAKVSIAKKIEQEAENDHKAKPDSDDAFDKDFKVG